MVNNFSTSSLFAITTRVFPSKSIWLSSPDLLVTILSVYFVLIIAGIVLNSVVFYVMVKRKRYRRNISSFFITHLAAVDLVYRVLLTPCLIYLSIPSSKSMASLPCKISLFVVNTCAAAIFGSLVVIAVDRYRNIVHPLKCLGQSKQPCRPVILVWLNAIGSSVMFLYTVQRISPDNPSELKEVVGNPTSCDVRPGLLGGISVTVAMVMTFLLPLPIIVLTYSAMFSTLIRRLQTGLVNKTAAKIKAKSARMLIMVVIGFVLCFGPSFVSSMIHSYKVLSRKKLRQDASVLSLVTGILELCSSLVNPLIYAFYSSDFRQDVVNVCGTWRSKAQYRI